MDPHTNNSSPPIPPPQPNKINWLNVFQSIDSKNGRTAVFVSIVLLGYGFGFYSSTLIKDREIVIMERQFNDLKNDFNIQKIQFERERSDSKVESNNIKIKFFNLIDSIKNGKK